MYLLLEMALLDAMLRYRNMLTIDPSFLPTGCQSIPIPNTVVCFLQKTDGAKTFG